MLCLSHLPDIAALARAVVADVMGKRARLLRWPVVIFAAYALFLQSLAMGIASARAADGSGGFVLLCSGTMTITPSTDGEAPQARGSGPCALCGLGHAAVDTPTRFALPLPLNIIETVAAVLRVELRIAPPPVSASARPRAPPAFV